LSLLVNYPSQGAKNRTEEADKGTDEETEPDGIFTEQEGEEL